MQFSEPSESTSRHKRSREPNQDHHELDRYQLEITYEIKTIIYKPDRDQMHSKSRPPTRVAKKIEHKRPRP